MGPCCCAAAIAMKEIMEQDNIPGTVIVYGCPAEETGGGKCFLARDGFFEGVDFAVSPHPFPEGGFMGPTLATAQVEYSFTGIASHASAMPEQGRSALDAAELMVMGVQFLREHIIQEARLHHAYLNSGGTSPNVVQAEASLLFYIRAPKAHQVMEIFERVNRIAKGAAMMTDTAVEIRHRSGLADLIPNDTLGAVLGESWAELGPCPYSEDARELAMRMAPAVGRPSDGPVLDERVPAYDPHAPMAMGSTDVGDVSYIVPSACLNFPGVALGTPAHSWQWVSQAASPIMHDGLIHAAKVLALTGMKLLADPALAEKARAELLNKTGGKVQSMLPENAVPEF
jgi:aminobenzoyl-glutamate utilization protein B